MRNLRIVNETTAREEGEEESRRKSREGCGKGSEGGGKSREEGCGKVARLASRREIALEYRNQLCTFATSLVIYSHRKALGPLHEVSLGTENKALYAQGRDLVGINLVE